MLKAWHLILLASLVLSIFNTCAGNLEVGQGYQYSKIQDAINAIPNYQSCECIPGSYCPTYCPHYYTILVHKGTYSENVLIPSKYNAILELKGDGTKPEIKTTSGTAVRLEGSGTVVKGFTITASGPQCSAVNITNANSATLSDNTITASGSAAVGIVVSNKFNSKGDLISNNAIIVRGDFDSSGIKIADSKLDTITGNTITATSGKGILIKARNSVDTISSNTITGTNGIELNDGSSTISKNTINGITNGIYIGSSSGNTISSNTITGTTGVSIDSLASKSNIITGNTINGTTRAIYIDSHSSGNRIYQNCIIGRGYSGLWNTWTIPNPVTYTYNGQTFTRPQGNNWSVYNGCDDDIDGIGDTPYFMTGGAQDPSPVMHTAVGRVYQDASGTKTGLSGWTVYIDANRNGRFDSGETSTTSKPDGYYSLPNLAPGTYTVRVQPKQGSQPTIPCGGSYSVKIGCDGSVFNCDFVYVSYTIASNPLPQKVCDGNQAVFSVTMNPADTGQYKYQWQKNRGSGYSDIPGETRSSYTITSPSKTDSGTKYRVITSYRGISCSTTSAEAMLTVNPKPVISKQPMSQAVCEGNKAVFSVTMNPVDTGQYNYRWQKNTGSGYSDIPGETRASFTTTSLSKADSGTKYRVITSYKDSSCSTTSAEATLTVNPKLVSSIITPLSLRVLRNSQRRVTFSVVVNPSDTGQYDYQWQKYTNSGWADISGEYDMGRLYTIVSPSEADAGKYRVITSYKDSSCSIISHEATLTVI